MAPPYPRGLTIPGDLAREWPHHQAHRFFSHATWSPDEVGVRLAQLIAARLVGEGERVTHVPVVTHHAHDTRLGMAGGRQRVRQAAAMNPLTAVDLFSGVSAERLVAGPPPRSFTERIDSRGHRGRLSSPARPDSAALTWSS
jgi:hypothetical protein